MNGRRQFLRCLLGAASAAVIDPEHLLWEKGRKVISVSRPVEPISGIAIAHDLRFHRNAFALVAPPLTPAQIDRAVRELNSMIDRWNGEQIELLERSPAPAVGRLQSAAIELNGLSFDRSGAFFRA